MKPAPLLAAITLAAFASPALALRIVLTNDDGLTSNLVAMYAALKVEGHDVIVSVPCTGQSGRGAAIVMLSPATIVPDNDRTQIEAEGGCHNGAAAIGAPAVGPFTKVGYTNGDYHYVHGTPVMATMYALDVLAPARWGAKAPDLVLSGPNEGQNVGSVVVNSGTIGNAQFALGRHLPAVALSAGTDTVDNKTLANPLSAIVAHHAVMLVKTLQDKAGKGPLLPSGMALNMNFPNGPTADLPWVFARQGSFDLYRLRFRNTVPYGLAMTVNDVAAASARQAQDEAVVNAKRISISAMQLGFESSPTQQQWLRGLLGTGQSVDHKPRSKQVPHAEAATPSH